jgi:hypothetical protein
LVEIKSTEVTENHGEKPEKISVCLRVLRGYKFGFFKIMEILGFQDTAGDLVEKIIHGGHGGTRIKN